MLETEANARSNIGPRLVSEITNVKHMLLAPTRAGRFETTLVTILSAEVEGGTCRYQRKVSVAEKPLATRRPPAATPINTRNRLFHENAIHLTPCL